MIDFKNKDSKKKKNEKNKKSTNIGDFIVIARFS